MSSTVKVKYPWMSFYPSDHRSDPALRMCRIAARGLWLEMLCLMHEAEPYGHLLSKGNPINNRQLAIVVGVPEIEIEPLIAELESQGVFSRDNSGVIYSRRMVRDFRKRERQVENGKLGGNPKLMRRVKSSIKPRDKAQKPETKDQKPKSDSHNSNCVTPESGGEREPSRAGFDGLEKRVTPKTPIQPDWKPSEVDIGHCLSLGMTRGEIDNELRKFILRHREKGTLSMDWHASWGSWCERWKDFNPTRTVSLTVVGMPTRFHVKEGTAQWTAWTEHLGKVPPMDRQFGWWFETEWPPGDKQEEAAEGVPEKSRSTP